LVETPLLPPCSTPSLCPNPVDPLPSHLLFISHFCLGTPLCVTHTHLPRHV
jgi:hypothetical protein